LNTVNLTASTVTDDPSSDTLSAGTGLDWYFANYAHDVVTLGNGAVLN